MNALLHRLGAATAAVLLAFTLTQPARADDPPKPELLVFAAASLTNVLGELSTEWTKKSGVPVKLSFAASSAMARQIEGGAKADVFVSADQEWMDYLAQRDLVDKATRVDLVGNSLVLIAPADSKIELKIKPKFTLARALGDGKLATGDPDTVPVGKYAKAALTSLNVWDSVADRIARAENVRSALMFVSRGESPLGIVYATDAKIEPKVRIVDTFPEKTHTPITYPGAAVKGAQAQGADYVKFLSGADAATVWKKFGFTVLRK